MSDFIFVSDDAQVWDMRDDGTWIEASGAEKDASSIHELLSNNSGGVYELVADLTKLPNPEPKNIGAVHETEHATYIRFTSEDLTDPWICTRTGVRFSWHHIQ